MTALQTVRNDPSNHRFAVELDGQQAIAEYTMDGGTITFTHTFVPESLRGRGLATLLVRAALDDARTRELRVVPQCPMFAAYMKAHPETHDLLAPGAKALLDD